MDGGWSRYPGADEVGGQAALPPVEPGRVVGIGAVCDLGPPRLADTRSQSFTVSEFVTLDDGRRVTLHRERGFTTGVRSTSGDPGDIRDHLTPDSITQDVLLAVLPDGEDPVEDHPWEWLADRARTRGLTVSAEDLRGLTYEVILTDSVTRWLAST